MGSQLAGGKKLTNSAALTLFCAPEMKPTSVVIFSEYLEASTFTEESTPDNLFQSGSQLLACTMSNTAQPVAEG